MIGHNSIVRTIFVPKTTEEHWKVKVQLNKNGGVCDIILPILVVEPVAPQDTSNGEAVRTYNQAMYDYRVLIAKKKAMRSAILNVVQGRPYIYAIKDIASQCIKS